MKRSKKNRHDNAMNRCCSIVEIHLDMRLLLCYALHIGLTLYARLAHRSWEHRTHAVHTESDVCVHAPLVNAVWSFLQNDTIRGEPPPLENVRYDSEILFKL